MSLRTLLFILLSASSMLAMGQQPSISDSAKLLNEVVVRAFEYDKTVMETPVAVGVIDSLVFASFNTQSIIFPVNTVPGVRMEERSPGSYRLSVRGSTLRSPFGVRNVKVYMNGAPLTDAGGNTYLNMIDPEAIGKLEIIKGPGSSLYGAGTGGVLLIESPVIQKGFQATSNLQGGSYGTMKWNGAASHGGRQTSQSIGYSHNQTDGYRNQTRMTRDMLSLGFRFHPEQRKNQINAAVFYSDLFYETPGALNLAEFAANPRQSRPATATLPSAEEQHAAVYLKSVYASLEDVFRWKDNLHIVTNIYGNTVDFTNSSIRNYELRDESTVGGRSTVRWNTQISNHALKIIGGGEFQHGLLPVKTYENSGGVQGAILTYDRNRVDQYSLFTQFDVELGKLDISGGLSLNNFTYNIDRIIGDGVGKYERDFSTVLSPRLAALYVFNPNVAMYATISRGFSPPTLAEIISSTGELNTTLEAELGTNVEAGFKFNILKGRINSEISAYSFLLTDAIVIKREQDIAEYFDNAGKTRMRGLESSLHYRDHGWHVWLSHAYQEFRFVNYDNGTDDFSGNELTGSPASILNGGIDWKPGKFFITSTINATSSLPLNDANSVYAESYTVVNMKAGYHGKVLEFYGGCDNLFDELYSLGNDINGFGGRYYNAAPGRSFYLGVRATFRRK